MNRKRFSIEQIVAVLKQAELGMPVADLIRQVGISDADVLSIEEAIRRDAVGSGPRTQAVAGRECAAEEVGCRTELGQGHLARHSCKKVARPALRRDVVDYVVSHYGLTMRRACRLVKQPRSVQYYRSVKDLRARMREIAYTRVCYGYRRVHVLLRQEGWQLGRNQTYRLYCEDTARRSNAWCCGPSSSGADRYRHCPPRMRSPTAIFYDDRPRMRAGSARRARAMPLTGARSRAICQPARPPTRCRWWGRCFVG